MWLGKYYISNRYIASKDGLGCVSRSECNHRILLVLSFIVVSIVQNNIIRMTTTATATAYYYRPCPSSMTTTMTSFANTRIHRSHNLDRRTITRQPHIIHSSATHHRQRPFSIVPSTSTSTSSSWSLESSNKNDRQTLQTSLNHHQLHHQAKNDDNDDEREEQSYQSFVRDLESLPSRRPPRNRTDVDPTATVVPQNNAPGPLNTTRIPSSTSSTWSTLDRESLRSVRGSVLEAFRASPELGSLFGPGSCATTDGDGADADGGGGPLARLIAVVGPIDKLKLVEMVVRHPHLMASVLRYYHRLKVSLIVNHCYLFRTLHCTEHARIYMLMSTM